MITPHGLSYILLMIIFMKDGITLTGMSHLQTPSIDSIDYMPIAHLDVWLMRSNSQVLKPLITLTPLTLATFRSKSMDKMKHKFKT